MRQKDLATQEQFMVVSSLILSLGEALKAIQVELALKGGNLGNFEILFQDGHKLLGIVDHKASSVGLPRDDMFESFVSNRFEHGVELERKRSHHTTMGRKTFAVDVNADIVGVIVVVVLDGNVVSLGAACLSS